MAQNILSFNTTKETNEGDYVYVGKSIPELTKQDTKLEVNGGLVHKAYYADSASTTIDFSLEANQHNYIDFYTGGDITDQTFTLRNMLSFKPKEVRIHNRINDSDGTLTIEQAQDIEGGGGSIVLFVLGNKEEGTVIMRFAEDDAYKLTKEVDKDVVKTTTIKSETITNNATISSAKYERVVGSITRAIPYVDSSITDGSLVQAKQSSATSEVYLEPVSPFDFEIDGADMTWESGVAGTKTNFKISVDKMGMLSFVGSLTLSSIGVGGTILNFSYPANSNLRGCSRVGGLFYYSYSSVTGSGKITVLNDIVNETASVYIEASSSLDGVNLNFDGLSAKLIS